MSGLSLLLHSLRWQDIVDILLLTLVASGTYRLIRRTVAVQVALGLAVLLAGSWAANYFGLILTSYLLSAIGAIAAIAIVVLFQSEIRRALGRINPSRWFDRGPTKSNRLDAAAIVTESAFSLAERKKGALIVIPRWDQVFDHVTAGTVVEARLSVPLIDAIFTSTSPLHDGAVVLREGRVLRAGVVLPLATESADPKHGTRHRAALGLARATDAMVVCVSEEYGTVSLAHDDMLEGMPDKNNLRTALQLLGSTGPRRDRLGATNPPSPLTSSLPHLAILIGVVGAWAALALDRSHAITRVVPLEIRGVTDGIAVDPPRQSNVAVELRSSRRELERLLPSAVEAYVELQDNSFGSHVYRIHARAPAGIEVASFVPDTVQIVSRPRASEAPPPNLHGETVTKRQGASSGTTRTFAREDNGVSK
jgi:diadenylate cyclase